MLFFIWNKFVRTLFFVIEIIVVCGFIACSLNPFFNLEAIWGAGFLGIAFPYFFFATLFIFLTNLIIKPRWAALILVIFLLNWKQIFSCFAPNIQPQTFSIQKKQPSSLRVLNWNVRRFLPLNTSNLYKSKWTAQHHQLIQQYQPDIICLQECLLSDAPSQNLHLKNIFQQLGYYYSAFSNDYQINDEFKSGNIIFSKFPIQKTQKIPFDNLDAGLESLLYIDILLPNQNPLRIYTTHLQSYGFKNKEYTYIQHIKNQTENDWHAWYYLFTKMRSTFLIRKQQADVLSSFLSNTPSPFILCGDFNDIPNSYTYNIISQGLHDAFLQKGWGIGNTYKKLLPTLRIDYIFSSPTLYPLQFHKINTPLSDHFPIIADLQY